MLPTSPEPEVPPVTDRAILRALWPALLAAVISLFPFTIYSTFLVSIADGTGESAALVGALRGLGGVSALLIGVVIAPVLSRWSAPHATATSLALLAGASLIAMLGTLPALLVFCLGIGAATAMLIPTLLRIATDTFPRRGDAGRAATMVTAVQSLAAVLAAPIIGAIGLWKGWHGALGVTAVAAAILAALFRRSAGSRTHAPAPPRYGEAFARLRRRKELLALVAIASLRTTAFMGSLAFLAVHYSDVFGLDPIVVTWVWTLSGVSFFVGNFLAGRWARGSTAIQNRLLYGGLTGAAVGVMTVFTTHYFLLALAATALMGFSHAIVAALVTTLISDRGGDLRTPTYSVNAAGMSLGVFVGALVAGTGFAFGGSLGMAVALVIPTLLALPLVPVGMSGIDDRTDDA